jgi:hypothetical protein
VEDLDPLFMTNKNLGIRKTPQTVVEFPFYKSRCDMGMSNNDDLTLAQASFQLSPQAQQNARAKMLKSGSSVVCSSRTP